MREGILFAIYLSHTRARTCRYEKEEVWPNMEASINEGRDEDECRREARVAALIGDARRAEVDHAGAEDV